MSGRTLVLLRHGRTAWNHGGRVQGQLEVDLDDEGHAQAARTAPAVAALAPTLLWSSDLARTRQTTAHVAAATGLDPTFDPRLREFFFGEREGLTHEDYRTAHPAEHDEFRRGHYDAVPSAERTAAVRERMVGALEDLLAALGPGETGVAVSHGAAIRVATGAVLGWPDDQFHTLDALENCAMVVLQQHPGVDGLRLGAWNRVVDATR